MGSEKGFLLFNYFKPAIYLESYKKINLSALKNNGIKLILCDVDNTLMNMDERVPSKDVVNFVDTIKKMGFEFALFSNNIRSRVERCAKKLGVENYFWNCKKPFLWKLKLIKKIFNYRDNEIVIIGDQLITDVFVANRAHIKSVLLTPLSKVDKANNIVKIIERFLFKKLNKSNLLHEGFYNEEGYEDGIEIL